MPNCRGGAVEVAYYLAKFLAGGALVVLFALISEMFEPKRFAGIFAAAPSILFVSHRQTGALGVIGRKGEGRAPPC